MRNYILHLIIFIVLCPLHTSARLWNQHWRNITLKDGLAGLTVTDFAQDQSGMMWIATSNGISLFNGSSIFTYPLPRTSEGVPSYTYEIALDTKGNVYAATRGGIYKLERYSKSFQRIVPEIGSSECLLPYGDKLYVGNHDGLYIIDKNLKVKKLRSPYRSADIDFAVRCIRKDDKGNIWFSTASAINWINPHDGKIQYKMLNIPTGLSRFDISHGRLFLGTKNHGLYIYDPTTGKTEKIENAGNVIANVKSNSNGQVAVASNGNGAYIIDGKSGKVISHYAADETDGRKIPDNGVYVMFCDNGNRKWIGMYNMGFGYTYGKNALVHRYTSDDFTGEDVNVVSSYISGKEKIITTNGGFYFLDGSTGKSRFLDTKPFNMQILNHVEKKGSLYYIGSYDNGIITFNPQSGRMQRIGSDRRLSYVSVSSMTKDPKGSLWITTSEGLFRIMPDGRVKNYNEFNSKLFSGARNIVFDDDGNGWTGTTKGLCMYIPTSDIIKNSDFPKGFWNDSPNLTLHKSHNKRIIASYQTNLFYTDYLMTKFGRIDLPEGILDEYCNSFVDDMRGHYFLASEKGLFVLNYSLDNYQYIGQNAGLDCNKINSLNVGQDGKLWISTDNGLFYINTADIGSNKQTASILPDKLSIGGNDLLPEQLLRVCDRKELPIGWNFVSDKVVFKPLTDNFGNTEGMVYNYQIDNGKWKMVNIGKAISLGSLSLGTHQLRLRVAGCNTVTTYTLRVYPNKMAWAELLLLILAIGLLLWWRRYHKRTNLLLKEHQETERALINEAEDLKEEEERDAKLIESEGRKKYSKSNISDEELAKTAQAMDSLMKEKKPYLDKELKMSDVASTLGTTPSTLSQVFTLYLKENYYDYVNKFRLEEFKQKIHDGAMKHYTITAISEQCGFRKTAFFSTFRRMEGMTPTEYIRKIRK